MRLIFRYAHRDQGACRTRVRGDRGDPAGSPGDSPTVTGVLDFSDPEFLLDPYPVLADLRDRAPLGFHAPSGRWLAASHAAVRAVLRDRRLGRFWTDLEPAAVYEPFNLLHRHQMMENEPPVHTRLRSLVAGAFARGHVERLRPAVAAEAARLLAAAGADFDLLADFAEPLAVTVIAELLGVPAADRRLLRPWSAAIVRMYEMTRTPQAEAEALDAAAEFAAYLRDLAARRAAAPAGDLISHLIAARDGSDRLTGDELVASAILLLNAGHEASVNGLGNGVVALLRHPGELARVRADRALVPATVEEMLRYDSPSQLFVRTAAVDVEILGVTVPAGAEVAALLGAANRDPAVFAAPDRFDAGRDPNPHVSFGAGPHFCLGAPLARVELQAALTALLDHAPRLATAGEPARNPGFVLRGYRAVRLTAL
ncbi:cytochrome P450 [Actinoplanes sp. NEAU-A12]|uniref:Cytochrome P450 n=1 Tax=Actinoplanes sandaracinus TaxID=3045177 RepID=A0ABT6WS70_9ACTN|nr:cytochrome P450 [Actinoplanes sandaracinus]MDI6102578.1 cytochrome P450 [Actinoplanes sandaracinus]